MIGKSFNFHTVLSKINVKILLRIYVRSIHCKWGQEKCKQRNTLNFCSSKIVIFGGFLWTEMVKLNVKVKPTVPSTFVITFEVNILNDLVGIFESFKNFKNRRRRANFCQQQSSDTRLNLARFSPCLLKF